MKRIHTLAIALTACLAAWSQQAQEIPGLVRKGHDTTWYTLQREAWEHEVAQRPTDEKAWRNLFRASYYADLTGGAFQRMPNDSTPTGHILQRMGQVLPESFTYNLCRYRIAQGFPSTHADQAIRLVPQDVHPEDLATLSSYLWMTGETQPGGRREGELRQLMQREYALEAYPERTLRYAYNMLQSMDTGAVYFANGDLALLPPRLLQVVLGVRPDVTLVPLSFLHLEAFREALFQHLDVPAFEVRRDYATLGDEWRKAYQTDLVEHIIRHVKGKAYFFPDILTHTTLPQERLYNEGLLLRYSAKPYDNGRVRRRNAEEVYHMEYLTEPKFQIDPWEGSTHLTLNYVTLLAPLLQTYRAEGNKDRERWLYRILEQCIEQSDLNNERLEPYRQLLKP